MSDKPSATKRSASQIAEDLYFIASEDHLRAEKSLILEAARALSAASESGPTGLPRCKICGAEHGKVDDIDYDCPHQPAGGRLVSAAALKNPNGMVVALACIHSAMNLLSQRGYQPDSSTMQALDIARGHVREWRDAEHSAPSSGALTMPSRERLREQIAADPDIESSTSSAAPAARHTSEEVEAWRHFLKTGKADDPAVWKMSADQLCDLASSAVSAIAEKSPAGRLTPHAEQMAVNEAAWELVRRQADININRCQELAQAAIDAYKASINRQAVSL